MKPETERYLASRLAEKRAGEASARVLGLTKKVTTCDHCGRKDLSKTLAVQMPNGKVVHLGTDCAEQIRKERVARMSSDNGARSTRRDEAHREERIAEPREVVDDEHAPQVVKMELPNITARAISAGAVPPLSYMGAGMTSVVFCDANGRGWKVARRPNASLRRSLLEEAEWLADAGQVPYVQDHVTKIHAFHKAEIAIERECVKGRTGGWGSSGIRQVHDEISARMEPFGWSAPEFKEDSYVLSPGRGWVLVDASMPRRFGPKLIQKVTDLLTGRDDTDSGYERPSDYAFAVRIEMQNGTIDKDVGEQLLSRLAECKNFPCEGNDGAAGDSRSVAASLSTTGIVVRGVGEAVGSDQLSTWNKSGHVYRGMTQDEWYSVIARGYIQSTMRYSHPSEGTSFSDSVEDAESYVNFGSDDPRKTGRPNYLVEVKRLDFIEKSKEGYFKTHKQVPSSAITRVWRMVEEGGAIVAYQIR